jgi:hypothetical protein
VAAEAARGLTLTAAAPSGEASNCQSTMAGEASGGGVASSRRVAAQIVYIGTWQVFGAPRFGKFCILQTPNLT